MTSPELDPNVTAAIEDSFAKQGLMRTIGAELHLVASGEVRLRINASESLTQHHGFLHAGIIGTILDSSCGWASQTLMPLGTEVLTVEYKLNLLRPAAGSNFEGRAPSSELAPRSPPQKQPSTRPTTPTGSSQQ